ncbi:FAD-dependent oxidoreductase [Nocardia otitidiscaviarum]|uniref:NAD(P)/FAD-dependent oxidoreductase n=1 Tax=Nocardia otitidiscaviarum TaxID=1823 RepID=UPI0005BB7C10|nr:FAD-dependent oxidoreductase [Nocardia otitidiscaviarum]MBF6136787.1 FAD-dependent oxidoreductase [Nocardia otitidiscaviarum]MBF6484990.1 FAD-dependent oxidoreductase [Nocardia otitidiscaviarum]
MSGRIVIAGAGVAGATAAKTLRREGYSGEVVLVGAESGLPYRRPMVSKEILAATAAEPRTLLESADTWPALEIDLRTDTGVEAIEPDAAKVRLSDGTMLGYDRLLLATGARPRRLPGAARNVHTLRGVADVNPLRAAAFDGGSLLIVGAGLIGCEVAATLAGLGVRVTVLHAGPTPLDRVVPAVVGEYYRRLHADHGVRIHTDVLLDRLDDTDTGVLATAADGRTWSAPTALIAIGATPNTDLAAAAGLAVADGILVDDRHRTSVPGIYAAGDAAARFDPALGTHRREEHWNSAQSQGAAAAKAMLGFDPPPLEAAWGWSTQYGVNLQFAGRFDRAEEIVVDGSFDPPSVLIQATCADRPVGVAAIGRAAEFRSARARIAAERESGTGASP